jgi:ATP-dependent protease ClpP protease subunit
MIKYTEQDMSIAKKAIEEWGPNASVKEEVISSDHFNPEQANFSKDGKFFIYGEIDDTIPQTIIQPLIIEITNKSLDKNPNPIPIFLNSPGGRLDYCFEIIALFHLAQASGVPIFTYALSTVASAASLIAVSGSFRYVSKRASHLLHFARGWDYAHNPDMADRNNEHFKFLQNQILEVYRHSTKLRNIDQKLLADNFIISGGYELVKQGLADQVV